MRTTQSNQTQNYASQEIISPVHLKSNVCKQNKPSIYPSSQDVANSKRIGNTIVSNTESMYSKTNNIRSKVKISERSFRPKCNIPLLIGSKFNFIPERVTDDGHVVQHGESPITQSSQFFGGLPVPYRDTCMNYH